MGANEHGLASFTVCAHAGFGPVRATGTNGSMVSHLAPDVQTHFMTATAAPCASLFKPVWLGANLPDTGPVPQGDYDATTLFWRHEALHRTILRDYATRIAMIRDEQATMEKHFVEEALNIATRMPTKRADFSQKCFHEAVKMEETWLERVGRQPVRRKNNWLYEYAWQQFNRQAKMPPLV